MKYIRHVTTPEGKRTEFTQYRAHQLVVEPGKEYVQPENAGVVVVADAKAYADYDGTLKALASVKVRAIVHGSLAWETSLASIVVTETTDLRIEQLEERVARLEAWVEAQARGSIRSSGDSIPLPFILEAGVAWQIEIEGTVEGLKGVTLVLGTYAEGPIRG